MSFPAASILSPTDHSPTPKLKTRQEEEAEGRDKMVTKYKHKLSSLPKSKGHPGSMYNYQGFWYMSKYSCSLEGVMASQDDFQARPDEIFVASNPKSGTTWLKALAFAIVNRTKYKFDSTHPLMNGNPHDYVPFIEFQLVYRQNPVAYGAEVTNPQIYATHMPYVALPESIHRSGCRVVYICRDAKDVFVSNWFFYKKIAETMAELGSTPSVTFEEAFESFCKGVSIAGPYWDHVLGYYKASLEHPDKVLFLKYEEMKKDPFSNVKRLAGFLGRSFTADEEARGVVDEIIELCSFKKLKSIEANKTKSQLLFSNDAFFREGTVGDSLNHLTPKMIEHVDGITKDKFCDYDLYV